MQRVQVFLVSGFPVRVVLRNDARFSLGMAERTCLALPPFVPYNTVGEFQDTPEDSVTLQVSISKDILPQQPQDIWEEYLTLNTFWEKDEFDSVIAYNYEIEFHQWKASMDYFFNQIDPSQCVSYDHVVQITSDLSLEELSTFAYGQGTGRLSHHHPSVDEKESVVVELNDGREASAESTFVAFLEKQEEKRCKRRVSKATQRALERFRDEQAPPSSSSLTTTTAAAVADYSRPKKKKKSKAARRVRRNVSSQLPFGMKREDCDLIVARGVYRRGLERAQRVLDVFKQHLMPIDTDNTFSVFIPWRCNCRCGNVVSCGDLGGTTKLIYKEIIACLMAENALIRPIQPIECCRIDYFGGSGVVPLKTNDEALIGYGTEAVSVITLSLLSPRNCVIAKAGDENDRHSFHVRNGDIIIQNGLFLKHFRCGFEQNRERLDSHSAPRLSLTFMPIVNHNCDIVSMHRNQPFDTNSCNYERQFVHPW